MSSIDGLHCPKSQETRGRNILQSNTSELNFRGQEKENTNTLF